MVVQQHRPMQFSNYRVCPLSHHTHTLSQQEIALDAFTLHDCMMQMGDGDGQPVARLMHRMDSSPLTVCITAPCKAPPMMRHEQ